jgi:hypothetical protein
MAGALAFIVKAVLCELDGEAMVWRLMEARYKAFNHLSGQQFEAGTLNYIGLCNFHFKSKRAF